MWPPGAPYTIIATVLYVFIVLAGLVGNSFILATVLRWKEMRTPCNLLIMNIAIADMAVAGIAAPLRILEVHHDWPFGEFMCRFLVPLQEVFVCVSVVTHTTIALERYRAIVKPMMVKISVEVTRIVICVTWASCYVAAALPLAIISYIKEVNGQTYCSLRFPSEMFRKLYQIYLVLVFIALPTSVQTWAYLRMSRVVSVDIFHRFHSSRKTKAKQSRSSETEARINRRNSLVRMVVILVVIFQVCYIPRGILMILREFVDVSGSVAFGYTDMVALILYYLKHVLNPLIIFLTSSDFRSRWKKTDDSDEPRMNRKLINCATKNSENKAKGTRVELELKTIGRSTVKSLPQKLEV